LVAPIEVAPPAPETPPVSGSEAQGGSPTGSIYGVPEGMEGGVEGGEIGGVPGGVIGGVIGGTGTGPVPVRDFDRGPRPLRVTKPAYPQEAFVKKVEGTVVIEIVIDASGQVARARVVQSIPLLDRAALDCVREWLFQPALKHGRPVATVAMAPVSFRIY
jgi:protein TonB